MAWLNSSLTTAVVITASLALSTAAEAAKCKGYKVVENCTGGWGDAGFCNTMSNAGTSENVTA